MSHSPEPHPEPAADAGLNTLRLDAALMRDELARTLGELYAKFNLRLLIRDDPGRLALLAFAALGLVAAVVARSARRRTRGG